MKSIVIILGLIALLITSPALAATCRQSNGQQICIIDIQRSAKKHWEYRVIVSVDGIKTREVYNCRDRTKIQPDKTVVPLGDAGELVCRLFRVS